MAPNSRMCYNLVLRGFKNNLNSKIMFLNNLAKNKVVTVIVEAITWDINDQAHISLVTSQRLSKRLNASQKTFFSTYIFFFPVINGGTWHRLE